MRNSLVAERVADDSIRVGLRGTAGPSTSLRSGPTANRGRRDDNSVGPAPEKLATGPERWRRDLCSALTIGLIGAVVGRPGLEPEAWGRRASWVVRLSCPGLGW